MKVLLTSEQDCVSGRKLVCVSERLCCCECVCCSVLSPKQQHQSDGSGGGRGGLVEAPLFLLFLPFSLDSASSERFAAALTLRLNSFWSPYVREKEARSPNWVSCCFQVNPTLQPHFHWMSPSVKNLVKHAGLWSSQPLQSSSSSR